MDNLENLGIGTAEHDGVIAASSPGGGRVAIDADALMANDEQLLYFIHHNLHVPALCDVLDTLGYRNQAMSARVRPLLPDHRNCGFAGRARTMRWMQTDYVIEEDPYGPELEAMDSLGVGDVVVHSTDPTLSSAPWGELLTTVAVRNGAVGCVCDAAIRDTVRIIEMGFPVFYAGIMPLDSKGRSRVMDYDVPVKCGDVTVSPGEIIVADHDGVVVIPREAEQIALRMALEKIQRESRTRQELQQGRRLREVYDRYGVL